jgi:putative oxidoreductase
LPRWESPLPTSWHRSWQSRKRVGGLLLIAGLATSLVGAALAGDILVAILTAHIDNGFFAADGGFELALLLCAEASSSS